MSNLRTRDDASCPAGNGTTYTSTQGSQYELYCDFDFTGEDLPSTDAKSYTDCVTSCDDYAMDESEANGANCIGAVFGAADPNGNQCWLKYAITDVKSGGYMVYAARRVQYQIGGSPVYSEFVEPSVSSLGSAADHSSQTALLPLLSTGIVSTTTDVVSSGVASASKLPSAGISTTPVPLRSSLGDLVTSSSVFTNPPLPSDMNQSNDIQSVVAGTLTISGAASTGSILATTVTVTASSDPTIAPSAFASSSTQDSGSATNSSNDDTSASGLSTGAKVGIGVGAGILFTILLSLLVLSSGLRRRRRNKTVKAGDVASYTLGMKSPATVSLRSRIPPSRPLQELQGDEPPLQELDGAHIYT